MRYGAISDGWRADYEKGLSHLRRLLSLDRDNVRLLTALVETCGDWFLDLYNTGDSSRLASQVERFLPFALQLNRLTQTNGADLAVRSRCRNTTNSAASSPATARRRRPSTGKHCG